MNDDWTKDIKKLMADHKAAAPAGLLDDIKAEMQRRGLSPQPLGKTVGEPASVSRKARLVPLWLRRWAVAAAVAAVVTVTAVWWLQPSAEEQMAVATSHEAARLVHNGREAVGDGGAVLAHNATASSGGVLRELRSTAKTDAVVEGEEEDLKVVIDDEAAVGRVVTKDTVATSSQTHNVTKPAVGATSRGRDRQSYDRDAAPTHRDAGTVTLAAYYGGSAGSGGSAGMGSPVVFADANPYGAYPLDMAATNSSGVVGLRRRDMKAHHDQPVKLGVSVGFRLSDRWTVNSGVTYSYLATDFTADGMATQTQKLHYLGLPVTASYSVVRGSKAELYVTAGGEVEKLVSGSIAQKYYEDETVSESRPQWSVKAAVGGAYHFTPAVSVYAEPGVSYYFDNHSPVVNVYKDRPTSFSLNLGLRFYP